MSIGSIGVLEGEFPNAELLQTFKIAPDISSALDVSPAQHACRPNLQPSIHTREEILEIRSSRSHERTVPIIRIVMSREAKIGEPASRQFRSELPIQEDSIREKRDFRKEPSSHPQRREHGIWPQQRLTPTGDHESRGSFAKGKVEIAFELSFRPDSAVLLQGADGGLGEAEFAVEIAGHSNRQHTAGEISARVPCAGGGLLIAPFQNRVRHTFSCPFAW